MTVDTFTAISINGLVCDKTEGGSRVFQKLSDPEILNFRNKIRDRYDAILVGANTILIDNPNLFNSQSTNRRVIIDTHNNLPLHLKIFINKPENTLLITEYRGSKKDYYQKLVDLGIRVLFMDTDDLKKVIKELERMGLNYILIEGGPETINRFLKANLVNSLQVVVFPVLFRKSGKNLYEGMENYSLKLIEIKPVGKKYLFMRYSV